jgi:hypothetical protein
MNNNGQFETRDILNLGGNQADSANQTDEALQGRANAAQQRNNANWLDANNDHILDAKDPAFAAIKLFIDTNNNGQNEAGEAKLLGQAGIKSINLATGEVTYTDGHQDKLTAKQLTADTEGFKLTQIQEVQADGTLKTLDAGTVLEHEGYQGQIKVTDDGGTRWGTVRTQTYEQDAKVVGDWEGTDQQEEHRHGGGNVLADGTAAPTETTATKLGASPNKGGRVQGTECSEAKRRESSPDPIWLGRVADRPMGVSVAGLGALQAANDAAWRLVA